MLLYKKIEKTVKRYDMLKAGDKVLVGVSGGPDSVFLLHSLICLRNKYNIDIYIAHLDHGLRGRASRDDSTFVKKLSRENNLKCYSGRMARADGVLPGKLSIEETMREKRYAFFAEAASELGANILATGHTLDDQAETVLMRVIKGSTIKGLAGIPPVARRGGLKVIRPLIEIEKAEILSFLGENGIAYRTDHTNLEDKFLRNKIRNQVMPYLAKLNPKLKRSLSLMAESLREDREFIEEEKRKRKNIDTKGGSVNIMLKDIVVQPKALRREILRDAILQTGASVKKLTYRHWRDMDYFLKFNRRGQSLDLPGGVKMKRSDKTVCFSARS